MNITADLRAGGSQQAIQYHVFRSHYNGYAYLDRRLKLEEDWLRDEDFSRLGAEIADFCFQELHLLARSAASDLQQSVDDGIEVYIILVRHGFCPLGVKRVTGQVMFSAVRGSSSFVSSLDRFRC
jgi:hypothetical protein